jgi:hypothetical protein
MSNSGFGIFSENYSSGLATSLYGMNLDSVNLPKAENQSPLIWNSTNNVWTPQTTSLLNNINSNDIPFIPNAVSISYIEVFLDSKTQKYTATAVSVNNNGIGYPSIEEAVEALSESMASETSNTTRWFVEIIIGFGSGVTWVNKSDRNLTNEGSAYGPPKQFTIGNSNSQIGNLKIVGAGPGASTIRGSCQFIVKNLMRVRENMNINANMLLNNNTKSQSNGTLQFKNKLLISGMFWVGTISIYLTYDKGPYGNPPQNINTFPSTPSSTDPQGLLIADWNTKHSVGVEVIQFWLELPNYPISDQTTIELSSPIFDISVPACNKVYMRGVTVLTYVPMAQDLPVSRFITQYRNDGSVTDYFYQNCSFSSRTFNAPSVIRSAYKLVNAGKVSIIDSQFSGQLECQSNKLAVFNSYILGTGLPKPSGSSHLTTQAILFTKPTHYSLSTAPTFGFNNFPSGPRLILSNVIFICHTSKFFSSPELENNPALLPFDYSDWTNQNLTNTSFGQFLNGTWTGTDYTINSLGKSSTQKTITLNVDEHNLITGTSSWTLLSGPGGIDSGTSNVVGDTETIIGTYDPYSGRFYLAETKENGTWRGEIVNSTCIRANLLQAGSQPVASTVILNKVVNTNQNNTINLSVKFSNVNFYMVHPGEDDPSTMKFDGTVISNLRQDTFSLKLGSLPF